MRKSKKLLLAAVAVILFAAVIGAVCIGTRIVPTVSHALRISELLQPVTEAKNQTMRVSVLAGVNGETVSVNSDIYMVTEENIPYLALEQKELTLYITDSLLLLENGKAFKLGETLQAQTVSYEALLPHISALYDVLKITAEETEDAVSYGITVTGEQMDTLLAAASLWGELPVEGIQKLDLSVTEKNGKLEQIRFSGSGELDERAVELDVTVSGFRILASGDYPVPDAVKQTAATADPDALFSLTEDLYRLVQALMPLTDMERIDGKLKLRADCGPVQLDTEMRLSDLMSSASGQLDPEQLRAMPEMIGLLCMEGDIRCTREGNGYVYALELNEAAMQQLARMILPEIQQYGGNLTEGAVTVRLEGGAVTSMEVSIDGKISVLIAQIPISVSAEFVFD